MFERRVHQEPRCPHFRAVSHRGRLPCWQLSMRVINGVLNGAAGLADNSANGLQGRELVVVPHVQRLVGVEILRGEHLSARGAHLAVQLDGVGVTVSLRAMRLPCVFLVLAFPSSTASCGSRLFLQSLAVSVRRQELLLLDGVWQQDQQLVEDAVEVFAQQVLAAAVILGCRQDTLETYGERQEMRG